MYRLLRVACGCLTLSAVLVAQTMDGRPVIPPQVLGAAESISIRELQATVSALTAPEMEGRYTPSAGLARAATFLADALQSSGVQPQPGRAYLQDIPLVERLWDVPNSSSAIDDRPLVAGEDFFATPAVLEGTASGRLVYVGHGFQVPAKGLDPYQGVDVRGKIVVTTTARPQGLTLADTPGAPGTQWYDARTFGLAHGAAGIVLIPNAQFQSSTAAERLAAASRPRSALDPLEIRYLPAIAASTDTIRTLFAGAQVSGDAVLQAAARGDVLPSFSLPASREMRFTVALKKLPLAAANVIGVIPGRDAALRHEHVVLGAHYDHLGVLETDGTRAVYPGADDNASGTAAVLAIAGALAKGPPPRRSVIVVFFASEERFHEGSKHFVRAPTVPVRDIAAMINLDMVGRSGPRGKVAKGVDDLTSPGELFVQGPRLTSLDLADRMRSLISRYGSLSLNGGMDEPPYPLFWGSDHTAFAQAGVPTAFFFDGLHEDFHKPTDTAEKIDYKKVQRVAHDVALLAWHLADAEQRPTSKPLPPELSVP